MEPTPLPTEQSTRAEPGTGHITGTGRIRRTVTGSIRRPASAGEPVQVVCKGCGKPFMAARREGSVQVPCVHCGCIQSLG